MEVKKKQEQVKIMNKIITKVRQKLLDGPNYL